MLIYPRTQFYTYLLPSTVVYAGKNLLDTSGISGTKTILWYSGINIVTKEMIDAIRSNNHTLLIENVNLRKKYQNYLDLNIIPDKYKKGKSYYNGYDSLVKQNMIYPSELHDESIFKRDNTVANSVKKLLTPDASPGLADDSLLKQLPKAYFVVCEWDPLKDQILIYAERLRRNGVQVDIDFYENCFHGVSQLLNSYKIANKMLDGVIKFIKNNID